MSTTYFLLVPLSLTLELPSCFAMPTNLQNVNEEILAYPFEFCSILNILFKESEKHFVSWKHNYWHVKRWILEVNIIFSSYIFLFLFVCIKRCITGDGLHEKWIEWTGNANGETEIWNRILKYNENKRVLRIID